VDRGRFVERVVHAQAHVVAFAPTQQRRGELAVERDVLRALAGNHRTRGGNGEIKVIALQRGQTSRHVQRARLRPGRQQGLPAEGAAEEQR
jgi:hypothetical protein